MNNHRDIQRQVGAFATNVTNEQSNILEQHAAMRNMKAHTSQSIARAQHDFDKDIIDVRGQADQSIIQLRRTIEDGTREILEKSEHQFQEFEHMQQKMLDESNQRFAKKLADHEQRVAKMLADREQKLADDNLRAIADSNQRSAKMLADHEQKLANHIDKLFADKTQEAACKLSSDITEAARYNGILVTHTSFAKDLIGSIKENTEETNEIKKMLQDSQNRMRIQDNSLAYEGEKMMQNLANTARNFTEQMIKTEAASLHELNEERTGLPKSGSSSSSSSSAFSLTFGKARKSEMKKDDDIDSLSSGLATTRITRDPSRISPHSTDSDDDN